MNMKTISVLRQTTIASLFLVCLPNVAMANVFPHHTTSHHSCYFAQNCFSLFTFECRNALAYRARVSHDTLYTIKFTPCFWIRSRIGFYRTYWVGIEFEIGHIQDLYQCLTIFRQTRKKTLRCLKLLSLISDVSINKNDILCLCFLVINLGQLKFYFVFVLISIV